MKTLEEGMMPGFLARSGAIVCVGGCLLGAGAAQAWKVTTSNHNVDNKGLDVAQTDPTLDCMQGDEAKFQKTFLVGPEAVFIDAVAPDDGVDVAQANMSIKHPQLDKAIGAVTIGIAVGPLFGHSLIPSSPHKSAPAASEGIRRR
jgi:hypothetical protein